ncbi:hypothetical protein GDO81_000966 [Engystomops pustulosus]|uniref:Uncharacterized protein n=1 Tax=Engystomops pustulosus TaxID=76066 RepID=A0AAV7D8R3_ENGPU|nr:hypothetical protein GDO81_000966 [Engystomops pustulosus]
MLCCLCLSPVHMLGIRPTVPPSLEEGWTVTLAADMQQWTFNPLMFMLILHVLLSYRAHTVLVSPLQDGFIADDRMLYRVLGRVCIIGFGILSRMAITSL